MAVAILQPDEGTDDHYGRVPSVIARDPSLSPAAKAAYLILKTYAWDGAECFPSQETIAADLGVQPRAVRKYLNELRDAGLIAFKRSGFSQSNRYQILPYIDPSLRHGRTSLIPVHSDRTDDHSGSPEPLIPVHTDPSLRHGRTDEPRTIEPRTIEPRNTPEVSPELTLLRESTDIRVFELIAIFHQPQTPENIADWSRFIVRWTERLPSVDFIERATECRRHPGYQKKLDKVDWLKTYGNWLRKIQGWSKDTPEPRKQAAPAKSTRSAVPFWDTLYTHLSRLAEATELPARQMQDFLFETFTPVSYENNVLTIRPPANLHPYKRKVWPVTLQRVAEDEMHVDDLVFVWEDEVAS